MIRVAIIRTRRSRQNVYMILWHGGRAGLKVGDELLPPSRTGLKWTSRTINESEGLEDPFYREDRVYATSDRSLAHAYAGYWTREPNRPGHGSLYLVEFDDDSIEDDEDFPSSSGLSYQAPSGRIIAVEQPSVGWQSRKHQPIFARILKETNRRARERAAQAESNGENKSGD
jgi:hypothetical protein